MPAMVAEWICSAANRFVVPLPTYVLAVAARRPPRGVSRSGRGGLTGHDSTSSRRSTRRSCWPADRGTGRRPGQRRRRRPVRAQSSPTTPSRPDAHRHRADHVRLRLGRPTIPATSRCVCARATHLRVRSQDACGPTRSTSCGRLGHASVACPSWACRAALADHHACNWLWRRAVPPTTRCVRRALRRRPREHRHDPSAAGKAPLDRLAVGQLLKHRSILGRDLDALGTGCDVGLHRRSTRTTRQFACKPPPSCRNNKNFRRTTRGLRRLGVADMRIVAKVAIDPTHRLGSRRSDHRFSGRHLGGPHGDYLLRGVGCSSCARPWPERASRKRHT